MAKPPKATRLRVPLSFADVSENTLAINNVIDDTVQCLANGLTVEENFAGYWIEATFQAPVTSRIRILTSFRGKPLSKRPRAVLLSGLWQTQPQRAPVAFSVPFSWDFDAGYIVTDSAIGIVGTGTYQMTLLVLLG